MNQDSKLFEQRKRDHIRIALDPKVQAKGHSSLNSIELIPEALPDLDFADLQIQSQSLGLSFNSPIFISSMTAGHNGSVKLNARLARACAMRGWLMGVGSQRKELSDPSARQEWQSIRKECPDVQLAGNVGLAQLISAKASEIQALVDSLEAVALFVHTNPLQECLQPEGTPQFRGGLEALKEICQSLSVPVILKEVGCGISKNTLLRVRGIGLGAVDVSGLGGTHWGRIEGQRSTKEDKFYQAAETFATWGISSVDSLLSMQGEQTDYELWASGGVRSGLDAAKLIALGAHMVGVAQPFLEAAVKGEEELLKRMDQFDFELRIALFVTGCADLTQLRERNLWQLKRT